MYWVNIVLGVTVLAGAAAMVWLAWASRNRTLPLNWFAGYRTNTILKSETGWKEAHYVAAPWTARAGVIFGITGIGVLFPLSDLMFLLIMTVGLLGGIGCVWIGAWVAQQTAKRVLGQSDSI